MFVTLQQEDFAMFIQNVQRFPAYLQKLMLGESNPLAEGHIKVGLAVQAQEDAAHGVHKNRIHRSSESSLKCGSQRILVQSLKNEWSNDMSAPRISSPEDGEFPKIVRRAGGRRPSRTLSNQLNRPS
jgi:hypothetical protein